jgi:hypothetical protein
VLSNVVNQQRNRINYAKKMAFMNADRSDQQALSRLCGKSVKAAVIGHKINKNWLRYSLVIA